MAVLEDEGGQGGELGGARFGSRGDVRGGVLMTVVPENGFWAIIMGKICWTVVLLLRWVGDRCKVMRHGV